MLNFLLPFKLKHKEYISSQTSIKRLFEEAVVQQTCLTGSLTSSLPSVAVRLYPSTYSSFPHPNSHRRGPGLSVLAHLRASDHQPPCPWRGLSGSSHPERGHHQQQHHTTTLGRPSRRRHPRPRGLQLGEEEEEVQRAGQGAGAAAA